MKNRDRFLSFILVMIMLAAAAITVNHAIFGHDIAPKDNEAESKANTDTITVLADGSTIIHTAPLPGLPAGYAGAVPLDIYVKDGRIAKVEALPNAETPSFFKRASSLLSAWDGLSPREGLDKKVDGITGATFSSTAIIANVHAGLDHYLGVQDRQSARIPLKIWIALAVTLTACIVPLVVKNKHYHTVQMIANVAVLGFWAGQFLDYSLILKYFSHGFAMPAAPVAIVMLVAAFIYPLFGRPQHYCTHICPLGSAQQLAGMIPAKKVRISPKIVKGLDWFRKILWAALMLLLWADCATGWMDLELFQSFMFKSAAWYITAGAVAFILLSVFINRPYCRFVCPTGSLFKRAENIG